MNVQENSRLTVVPTGAALDTLPTILKRAIVGKSCKHDASRNSVGDLRKGFPDATDPRQAPGTVHPLVRTHPMTRKNSGRLVRGLVAFGGHGGERFERSLLHLERLDRHLDKADIHGEPSLYCPQFSDFLLHLSDVHCGHRNAGHGKRQWVPHFLHEFEPVFWQFRLLCHIALLCNARR